MIFNVEQDNTIEGTYLIVETIDSTIPGGMVSINLPENFYLDTSNCQNWVIGWGNQKPYYDAGVENIRTIKNIQNRNVYLGDLKRGQGFPVKGQKVCFWNKSASGFKKKHKEQIITPSMFKGFVGNSIGFSSVVFDSTRSLWIALVNEVDTDSIQTYAASSSDLINWNSENDSLPILTNLDFLTIEWGGWSRDQKSPQSALVNDIIKKDSLWYLFVDGYNSLGERNIGLITTKDLIKGPFKIKNNPLILSDSKWKESSVYYSKVQEFKDGYLMFFTGESVDGVGKVGVAFSTDLNLWNENAYPVISDHSGWRSKLGTSSTNYIEIRDSIIYLLVAGTKQFHYGKEHDQNKSKFGMGLSGNVGDAQLGAYMSTDSGKTFVPHMNNPVFNNNYADSLENEHMGGNFEKIDFNGKSYIIYQAKTTAMGHRYGIYIREKSLN